MSELQVPPEVMSALEELRIGQIRLHDNMTSMESRLKEEMRTQLRDALLPIERRLEALELSVRQLQQAVWENRQAIEENRKAIEENRKAIEENRKAIEENRKAILELRAELEAVRHSVDRLRTDHRVDHERIARLEIRMGALERSMGIED